MKSRMKRVLAMVMMVMMVTTIFTGCARGMKLEGTYERQNSWFDLTAQGMPSSVEFEGYNAKVYFLKVIPLESTYRVYRDKITFTFKLTDSVIDKLASNPTLAWMVKKWLKKPTQTYTFELLENKDVKIGEYIYKKVK